MVAPNTRMNGIYVPKPHQGEEAERNVLGAMLLDPDAVPDCAILSPSDFYLPKHGRIYRAVVTSFNESGLTDPITVGAVLAKDPLGLEEAGGHEELMLLMEGVITAKGIRAHAKIVKEHSECRRIERALQNALARVGDGTTTADDLRGFIKTAIEGGTPAAKSRARVRSYAEFMHQPDFRWLMRGALPTKGTLLLGGKEHTGKTMVVVDWLHRCLFGDAVAPWCDHEVRSPCSALYIAAEDAPGVQLRSQAFVRERVGGALAEQFEKTGYVDGRTIDFVDRMPAMLSEPTGIAELEQLILDFQTKHGHLPGIVVLDTLSTLFGADENDNSALGMLAKDLARIADQYELLIVVVHHLRKPAAGRATKPSSSEMRGGSVLAGNFDSVWLLWRKDDTDLRGPVEVYCAKGKNGGSTGTSHHLASQWVVLGENEDGDEIGAPIHIPTAQPAAKSEADEHSEVLTNIDRIARRMVAVLRDPKKTDWVLNMTQAETLTTGKAKDKRDAWRMMVSHGWVEDVGNRDGHHWQLTDKAPKTSLSMDGAA